MGLEHQEACKAAHPIDIGEAFQLAVTSQQLSATMNPKERSATRRHGTRPMCCSVPPRTLGSRAPTLCLPNTYQ